MIPIPNPSLVKTSLNYAKLCFTFQMVEMPIDGDHSLQMLDYTQSSSCILCIAGSSCRTRFIQCSNCLTHQHAVNSRKSLCLRDLLKTRAVYKSTYKLKMVLKFKRLHGYNLIKYYSGAKGWNFPLQRRSYFLNLRLVCARTPPPPPTHPGGYSCVWAR